MSIDGLALQELREHCEEWLDDPSKDLAHLDETEVRLIIALMDERIEAEIAALRAERDRAQKACEQMGAQIIDLRARVEALETFVQDLADEGCRNQEACGETNLRLIDYCGPCRARVLAEKKP